MRLPDLPETELHFVDFRFDTKTYSRKVRDGRLR